MEEERIEPPPYIHIESNDFSYKRHKRQKEEDIAVCECQYDILDPESPCGEQCWNVHTNTECRPGYCHCGVYCKNRVGLSFCGSKNVNTLGQGWQRLKGVDGVFWLMRILWLVNLLSNTVER